MAKKDMQFDRFQGFPKEAPKFLKDLKKNNKREWFVKNKARYEEFLKAPFQALVEDCEGRFGSGKTFRIYQDQRFHKDRKPYKEHGSAVFEKKGVVYYVQLGPDELFTATGCHMMAKDQLTRFREAIDNGRSGKRLVKLVKEAREAGLEVGGSALKSAPRGYPKDHERIELLKHKGLTVSRSFPIAKWMHGKGAGPRIVECWEEGAAINQWLQKHVGESQEGRRYVKKT